jgi:type III secretory pathway component EscV
MKSRNLGLYAVALAIVVVGLLWAGLPAASLVWFALVLACPLMMFFMMRSMHGGDSHNQHTTARPHDGGHDIEQSAERRHHDSVG